MKRFSFIIVSAAILLPLLFIACQKEQEGVYNPKKKIERIYTEGQYHSEDYNRVVPRHLSEVWSWNGDQLGSISYYDDEGSFIATATFSYQNNRVDAVSIGYFNETYFTWRYTYQDALIVSMQEYWDNEQTAEIHFTHTGKEITRISYTRHDLGKNVRSRISPLRFILPSLNVDLYCKVSSNKIIKGESKDWSGTIVYELEWKNGNLAKSKYYDDDNYYDFTDYTYDTRTNPFYSSFFGQYEPVSGVDNLMAWCFPTSKNNVLSEKASDSNGYELVLAYNYVYNGKYPTMQEKNLQSFTIHGVHQNWTQREVIYYEYE